MHKHAQINFVEELWEMTLTWESSDSSDSERQFATEQTAKICSIERLCATTFPVRCQNSVGFNMFQPCFKLRTVKPTLKTLPVTLLLGTFKAMTDRRSWEHLMQGPRRLWHTCDTWHIGHSSVTDKHFPRYWVLAKGQVGDSDIWTCKMW